MRLRQFQGPSTREVMKIIRHELGPDVLIVSTEEDKNGQVKIVAAQDFVSRKNNTSDQVFTLEGILKKHRTPEYIVERFKTINTDSESEIAKIFLNNFRRISKLSVLDDLLSSNRPLMFIGTPGVGKTLVTAKIAAQGVLKDKDVKIISTDREKTGAAEQIEQIAKALHVPCQSIENPNLLGKVLHHNDGQSLTLIDTAGINPFDPGDRVKLRDLTQATDAHIVLVQCAGDDLDYSSDVQDAFVEIKTGHLILTKLDLLHHYGKILTRSIEGQYPLLAVGLYQQVANFLISPLSTAFADLFIGEESRRRIA